MVNNNHNKWYSSIDNSFIHNSIFKATTGILSLARAGVKGILGDDNRSVIVQIIDELVNGKYVIIKHDHHMFFNPYYLTPVEALPWQRHMAIMILPLDELFFRAMERNFPMKMWLCL